MAIRHGGARRNSGRKSNGEIEAARKLMDAVTPLARKKKIFRALADLAEAGNVPAIQLWLNYRYGVPSQKFEVETPLMVEMDE